MKILVTGGTGFIGSHLIARLHRRGDEIRCVSKDRLNSSFLESLNVEVVLADLNNGIGWDTMLDGVEQVFHLAGMTRARTPKDYYDGNYLATKKLVDVCRGIGSRLRRFVYVSSLSAVGPSLDGHPLSEEAPYHPVSDYGRSKMMGEQAVRAVADFLPVTILRPSAVFGPRERDLYDFMKIIRSGIHPLIGFGKKLLNMVYVDDLVNGILQASESERALGQTYFLGSDVQYATEDIGAAIERAMHRHAMKIRVPEFLVYGLAAARELAGKLTNTPVFLNLQKARETVQPAWTCSIEKARQQFGYDPEFTLEAGIATTYEWYKEHGWL
jgi:nucleoside-diphosphate-sugar epimerase